MKITENGNGIKEELEQYFKSTWLIDTRHTESITLCQAKQWIEGVFDKSYADEKELKKVLSNGVLLCRLVNKIVPETIPFVNVGKNPITWLENVQFFLDGCRRLGLKEDMLFDPYDLKYFGNDELELDRRNRNIAITLFWLSRVAPHLPLFADFEDYSCYSNSEEASCEENCTLQTNNHSSTFTRPEEDTIKKNQDTTAKQSLKKAVVFADDLCDLCKKGRARSSSGDRKTPTEDGKFTLLVEKTEESNEFGVTIKETDTDYPVITAVEKGSYAFKSGLQTGDYVITVNGINTNNMTLSTINNKIKSVFTDGHVYLGICRLPANEVLTDKHKDSPMFKERWPAQSGVTGRVDMGSDPRNNRGVRGVDMGVGTNPVLGNIPKIEVGKGPGGLESAVDSIPIGGETGLNEWRAMLEKHKRDNYKSELDHATIRDLWNKYIKTSEIDEVLKEVDNFNIDKANKYKESVAQTDGNDTLNRNLTLVGHKLRRSADTYQNHVLCGCCVQAIGTLSSIHLDNTNFTYHQRCFLCKHCGAGLLDKAELLYNVFVVDGLPYCDVCIKRMGMIRLGKVKKMPVRTSV